MCCDKDKCCGQPEKPKDKPSECSDEQIKDCHGDVKQHPCTDSCDADKK